MSPSARRRLRWILPLLLVAGVLLALALHPGANLEPEVRRFLGTVQAGTPEALGANVGLFPLWDPAELHAAALYVRNALGPLREVLSMGDPQRIDWGGMPRRAVEARLRFTRSPEPVLARFEFVRLDTGWTVSDFDIPPPPGVPTGAQRAWVVPEAERMAGLAARRGTSPDDLSARLHTMLDGLPVLRDLVPAGDEPLGAGWRVRVLATYEDAQAREIVLDLLPEDGRWRLAGIEVRKP
jgi:hypothetical protein